MAILSTMRDCAGCNPLLVPYPAENNLDLDFFGDAPVPHLEQAARLRPYHPIMVPTLCVMCILDNITPWCRPPLIAVCRCRRCNKPCCYWHSAAHDFQRLPTGAYGCYGNPTDQKGTAHGPTSQCLMVVSRLFSCPMDLTGLPHDTPDPTVGGRFRSATRICGGTRLTRMPMIGISQKSRGSG